MASSAESPAANGRAFYVASTRNRMSCSIKCMCCQLLWERNGLFFLPLKKWSIKMKDFSILTRECPVLTVQEMLYFIKCRVGPILGNWFFFIPRSSSSPEAAFLQHVQGRSGQTDSNSGHWVDWQRSTRQLHLAVSLLPSILGLLLFTARCQNVPVHLECYEGPSCERKWWLVCLLSYEEPHLRMMH